MVPHSRPSPATMSRMQPDGWSRYFVDGMSFVRHQLVDNRANTHMGVSTATPKAYRIKWRINWMLKFGSQVGQAVKALRGSDDSFPLMVISHESRKLQQVCRKAFITSCAGKIRCNKCTRCLKHRYLWWTLHTNIRSDRFTKNCCLALHVNMQREPCTTYCEHHHVHGAAIWVYVTWTLPVTIAGLWAGRQRAHTSLALLKQACDTAAMETGIWWDGVWLQQIYQHGVCKHAW